MGSPAPRQDESVDAWTDRLSREGSGLGVYRQCSIGWHGECSARHEGVNAECRCDCHGEVASPPLWSSNGVSAVEYGDELDFESEDTSYLTISKDEAAALAAVLTQWARS